VSGSLTNAEFTLNSSVDSSLRYSRLGLHARGGLGEVFLAQDEEVPREVALKEIRADRDDAQSRLRFLIEGTITGALEHPGIVPVYSLGAHADGRPFYAMRMIRGQTLHQAIAELHQGPVDYAASPFRKLVQRLVSVCQTLQYAHDRGVVHRDLKPANIMVGNYGETLVVDWGLAKILGRPDDPAGSASQAGDSQVGASQPSSSPSETQQGDILGTPAYMSPEQAAGKIDEISAATDVYALGATLYHLLTGQNPLVATGQLKSPLERVRQGDIVPAAQVKPGLPPALAAICAHAMRREATARYASASELAADLERWLADEPIGIFRESWAVRGGRWVRKHPGLAGAGATSVCLLLLAAVVVSAITSSYSQQLAKAYGELSKSHEALTAASDEIKSKNTALTQANTDLKVARDEATQNAAEAREQERAALAREAETEAVLQFVETRIFAAARPEGQEGGLGRNTTLGDALTAAVPYVDAGFPDQPLIQARLRRTLGESFLYLGATAEALQQTRQAHDLLLVARGPEHRETLAAAGDLALALHKSGQLEPARQLLEATYERQKKDLGEADAATLRSMHSLASVYEDLDRIKEAFALREAALQQQRDKLGEKHPDTLRSMNDLVYSYLDQQKLPEAIQLSEQTVARKREAFGSVHPETLGSIHTLAVVYAAGGKRAEALKLREDTLQVMIDKLGPEHQITLGAMQNLANSYFAAGQLPKAEKLYDEVVQARQRQGGADHPDTLFARDGMALVLAQRGRVPAAISMAEDVLNRRRKVLGPNHLHTIASMRHLALFYDAAGREADALAQFSEAFRRSRDAQGLNHPTTLERMFDLALALERGERIEEARQLREAHYPACRETHGAKHPETLQSMNLLAQSYLAVQRGADAEKLLRETLKLREQARDQKRKVNENGSYLAFTKGQLGEACLQTLKLDEAQDWFNQCLADFATLQERGELESLYFQGVQRKYRLKATIARKLERALENPAFINRQPDEEIAPLLEACLRVQVARKELASVVATAEAQGEQLRNGRVSAWQAAKGWSLASSLADDDARREEYAAKAVTMLQRMKSIGKRFPTPLSLAWALARDPDYAALQSRDDFRALTKDLPNIEQQPDWLRP
jgi:tRNA A-37 threonylcarbamoyl transferase component Bud32